MIRVIFTQKFWHELFEAGILLKALNSLWETAVGLFILFSAHPILHNWFVFFTREEYIGSGRDDFIFRFIADQLNHLSVSTRNFVGLYLLIHGLLNMFLSYNLYRNRLWAYPVSIATVMLFLSYQLYRLAHTHSLILLCVTVFDVVYIVVTWHEYRYQLSKRHHEHHGHTHA